MELRYLSAGESHGPALAAIVEGLPAGLFLDMNFMNHQLARRQGGFGRGGRMAIEKDAVRILSGVRFGRTLGSPVALLIENRDWANWQKVMSVEGEDEKQGAERSVDRPRPGHADLAGGVKYQHRDLRNVLERASARETATRVAVGSIAALLLKHFEMEVGGFVVSIGGKSIGEQVETSFADLKTIKELTATSSLNCPDSRAEEKMVAEIEKAGGEGDTLGGVFEIWVEGVPPGLGSHVHWDRRLDGRLAAGLMSIPGMKGVEIGMGFEVSRRPGSQVHDPIEPGENHRGWSRPTNRAGGLEGGMTNGETLVLRAAMKPIPTLRKPLSSVDLASGEAREAAAERSDVCAVPSASVVGEAVVAWEIARAFLEKFSGDSIGELSAAYQKYKDLVTNYIGEDKC